ncbi:MAG: hypothetical protein F4Y78_05425 [Candidatus Dadabacteria bacterium]|nr:hypothetical protein [Candidatus Dadabacteria bacterium]
MPSFLATLIGFQRVSLPDFSQKYLKKSMNLRVVTI